MKTALFEAGHMEDWHVLENYRGTGQPEGYTAEWREILEAMKRREGHSFRRVAVRFDEEGNAWFWSPRNSLNDAAAAVPAKEVDSWIADVELQLAEKDSQ
jgi:hypothetical protein